MPKAIKMEEFEAHFWSRVDKSGGDDSCWPWTGGTNDKGYGIVSLPICMAERNERRAYAHRIAYRLVNGPLPDGLPFVCHDCDNRPCCNARHLFPGTALDNVRVMPLSRR